MNHKKKLPLLLFALLVVISLAAVAASLIAPEIVTAQGGDDGDPGTPGLANPDLSSSSQDGNQQPPSPEWDSSANPPQEAPSETSSAPDSSPSSEAGAASPEGGLTSWRVIGSALKPRESNVSYGVDTNGGCSYVTAGSAFTVWNTPINLPQGSTVDTLRMYYYDTEVSNTTGWFTIYDLYGAIVDEWSVSSNTKSGNSFTDSIQINHVIDYSVYSYLINWRPVVAGSTMQLCGFRIFYTPPPFTGSFLPAINK